MTQEYLFMAAFQRIETAKNYQLGHLENGTQFDSADVALHKKIGGKPYIEVVYSVVERIECPMAETILGLPASLGKAILAGASSIRV